MKILLWGTYDKSKPRLRILLNGLRGAGVDIKECHVPIWENFEDKSQISSKFSRSFILLKIFFAYPVLLSRLIFSRKPDVILVAYPALLDIFVVSFFARVKRIPVVWDVFISLYNTIVEDRRLLKRESIVSRLLFIAERSAFNIADTVVLDTQSHAAYLADKYQINLNKVKSVFVGVEDNVFTGGAVKEKHSPVRILFYGQFIPLQGIETIIGAARKASKTDYIWTIVGKGQESDKIEKILEENPILNLKWIPWVKYRELSHYVEEADICLGIFGDTIKAKLVIPNKVFQIVSAGKPLVTLDSPAIRELFSSEEPGIRFAKGTSPEELLAAIEELVREYNSLPGNLFVEQSKRITSAAIGEKYRELLLYISNGCSK
jgi:glycosyltransferase involved in cell wall biosynthesis